MGKKGKRTPTRVRDFVVETKRNAPGLSDQQIADKVMDTFGEGAKIDKSTVGRFINGAGLRKPGPSLAKESINDDDSAWQAWRRDGATMLNDQAHQEFLKGQFSWLRMELEALSASFPKEWKPYYWPDYTSPRLKRVGNDKAGRMVWELDIEQKYGWPFLLEHLRTGLPNTLKAVEEIKGSYARCCQLWQALEECYRAQAQALQDQEPEEVNLNGSYFYWSILNEVDQGSEQSREEEYRVQPGAEGIIVVYAQRQLVQAEDEETLQRWADRHREWRREFLREHKGELDHVRRDVQCWVEVVVQAGQELEMGARVAGTCERCSGAVRGSTGMMSE